ncbi:MAG: polysaccharide biosynthesis protein [Bacteroidales bacterium]|nr:polysaccharide biosynthesis protein [Bacteroidales bacterium]
MKRFSIRLVFPVADFILTHFAFIGALILRFEGDVPQRYLDAYLKYGMILALIAVIVFAFFRLYSNLWQYVSIYELGDIFLAVTAFALINYLFFHLVSESLPRSVYILIWGLLLFLAGGIRLGYRCLAAWEVWFGRGVNRKKLLIIGAGAGGYMVIKELFEHPQLGQPVAVIDEDPKKMGLRIHGVPVVGTMEALMPTVKKYNVQEIIVAIPSAPETEIRRILKQCKETGCKLRRLPGLYKILDGKVFLRQIRDVNITDLLGRPEVVLDNASICTYLQGQVVLVTGAGGSIGSALCRQIARFNPSSLVMLDNYENNLYMLQRELQDSYPNLNLIALIGSIQDEKRIDAVFSQFKPQVIFHAAAHKHVPLMEDSPGEAIKNNIFGTINVAKAADRYNAQKFILISTDKAVNPTNVMGASKRVAEIAIQQINAKSKTKYAAVRFGNVLGSNGSVIPIFMKQIEQGGPITVTHPEVTRYFMTIQEAVQLVIQAGALALGGEVFILDMGEPVKILDLATDLIALSGYKEDDIPIVFTGLRPGEKMHEELLLDTENVDRTSHEKIFVCKSSAKISKKELEYLEELLRAAKDFHITFAAELAMTADNDGKTQRYF